MAFFNSHRIEGFKNHRSERKTLSNPLPAVSATDMTTEHMSQSESDGKPSPSTKSHIKKNTACSGGK